MHERDFIFQTSYLMQYSNAIDTSDHTGYLQMLDAKKEKGMRGRYKLCILEVVAENSGGSTMVPSACTAGSKFTDNRPFPLLQIMTSLVGKILNKAL